MTEVQLEQQALSSLVAVGYTHLSGCDIARLNPHVPQAAGEDDFKQVCDLCTPVLLSANRHFHSLRHNVSVDWAQRESVRAKLRLMVKRILRKYKYPPDLAESAVELVLEQAETIGEAWTE